MTAVRVTLRTIGARLLWDGRLDDGRGFIPGIGHYQAGVQALDAAARHHDRRAARLLAELETALHGTELSVRRWRRGIERFVGESLGGTLSAQRTWLEEQRSIRAWRPEVRRLAALIAAYDHACAITSVASAQARSRSIFNPHHRAIRERAGAIRHVVDLGYRGWLYVRRRLEQEQARAAR